MPTHDELQPLIDALTECAVSSTDQPGDRTYPETRRRVLAALWRIEKRDPGGLGYLLDGSSGNEKRPA